MDNNSELPQSSQNPEQKFKDPRIPKVIDELSKAARLLKDPRLLSLESNSDEPPPQEVAFRTADKTKIVSLRGLNLDEERLRPSNLPSPINEHERIIPVKVDVYENHHGHIKNSYHGTTDVWLTLDKDNPLIFQLIQENGKPYFMSAQITGKEKAIERPDLLPHILDAVSGEKNVLKDTDAIFAFANTYPPR